MIQPLQSGNHQNSEFSIQKQAFQTQSVYYSSQDAQLSTPSYDIEVHKLNLPSVGRGTYYSERHCFLEYVERPEHTLRACYPDNSDQQQSIGQLIFVPPGVALEWHWGKGVQRAVTCMFEVERFGVGDRADWRWCHIDLSKTFDIKNDYLLTGMRKLGEEACAPSFASDLQIESMLSVMSIELYREFMDSRPLIERNPKRLSTRQIHNVRDFVQANLGGPLTINRIADQCDLSPRKLAKQFKDAYGTSIRQFVAIARIEKAKQLLACQANNQMMIKQIGYQCGFRGPAAFVAAFKKATGVTPAKYRQCATGKPYP